MHAEKIISHNDKKKSYSELLALSGIQSTNIKSNKLNAAVTSLHVQDTQMSFKNKLELTFAMLSF